MKRKVLISGASIAGPVTAFWLARHGFEVVVVERAESLRLGGQNIDISDAARDVITSMGLEERVRERHTGEKGLQFVDSNDRPCGSYPAGKNGSWTREIEILRGDLAEILVDATRDTAEYRFGDSIESVISLEDSTQVRFASGAEEEFDCLIAADGMNSTTRKVVLG
ncbi:MAG: FAD-dependent monooxygenase, partial [Cyanobacteria bacterium J06648_11]